VASLVRIKEQYDPQWVIVETTGIAYPGKIQESLMAALKQDSRVAVLVDAKRWKRLLRPMHDLLAGQIINSAAVLINKCDLVDEETVSQVERDIRDFDKSTQIFRISALEKVPDEVWAAVLGE
jgi:G3E family GTPase